MFELRKRFLEFNQVNAGSAAEGKRSSGGALVV
jgi:hypothetical protein